ncbi:uncharacterized protein M6B38_267090 [Iris pallida]|uniref:Serine-rich protein-like protein n=1 Tax=Iris pallida TaxID=29817 RepID=A0AAX6I987_IRIPA|nr:uncharacterized protein M6B38_360270 [Iris pallida]KAJ6849836.1 uncharacterized protein M6B38_267090 [Iris pallida]
MSSSSRRSTSGPVLGRSVSPAGRFASSSTATFSSPSSSFFHHHHHHRSSSPTRINVIGSAAASGVRSAALRRPISSPAVSRRTCMCSPTSHPGSFRCSLHKRLQAEPPAPASSAPPSRLNMRRSAMTNSLVRIGTVEGDLVRRALAALIRPSSHQQRRRAGFCPRPSRLSVVSTAAADL